MYAIRSELDEWLASGGHEIAEPAPVDHARQKWGQSTRPVLFASVAVLVLAALFLVWWKTHGPKSDASVTIAAVAAPGASSETVEFTRGLTSDLARFANASPDLAVFEPNPGASPHTEYSIRAEVERANSRIIANAQLVAVQSGQVIWSRQFEQSGSSLSLLRAQVAANIVGGLRCSFGSLETERSKVKPTEIGQLMAICQSFQENEFATARMRARQLTLAHPDLAAGWAMLAIIQAEVRETGSAVSQEQIMDYSRRAAAIAPNNVITWLARAAASGDGPTGPLALPIIDQALRAHPDQPFLLNNRSVVLFNLGYVGDSAADSVNLVRSDPSSFASRDLAVRRLAAAGRTQEALTLQAENEQLWPGHPLVVANRLRIAPNDAKQREADLQLIDELEHHFVTTPSVAYMLASLYERRGSRQLALAWLGRAPVTNTSQQWSLLFWPDVAGLRTEPAFFRKMADLGLVRHWLKRGKWPDFCGEPGLKYDCRSLSAGSRLAASSH